MNAMPDVVILSAYQKREGSSVDLSMINALMQTGFQLRLCTTLRDVFSILTLGNHRIVLIDVMNCGIDGFLLASNLRSKFEPGILLLVGPSSDDRARALDSGADVCLSRPTSAPLVIACLGSLYRRMIARGNLPMAPVPHNGRQAHDEDAWVLAPGGWLLRAPNGAKVALNRAERSFLARMFQDGENILKRDQWHDVQDESSLARGAAADKSIDVLVSRLRRKIDAVCLNFPLRTVRGIGYQFIGQCVVAEAR